MVGGGDPAREAGVEFGEAVDVATFEAQGGFEVVLDGADETLDFAFAPGVVGLGVQKPDAEVGADDAGVVVDEGFALVGVELVRQAAAKNALFEAVQEAGRVAATVIRGVGDQAAVVVEQDAELGGDYFAFEGAQGWAAGEVNHPQVVGCGRFEGFGRAAFQSSRFEAAAVVAVGGKEAQHRA